MRGYVSFLASYQFSRALPGPVMTQLEEAFAPRAVRRGGLFLYDKPTALAFLRALHAAQVTLLGVDAFLLGAETTQPMMEHSLDVSSASFAGNSFNAAQQVIQQCPAGTYFEFTYD